MQAILSEYSAEGLSLATGLKDVCAYMKIFSDGHLGERMRIDLLKTICFAELRERAHLEIKLTSLIWVLSLATITGCSTVEKSQDTATPPPLSDRSGMEEEESTEPQIDVFGIQRSLRMERSEDELGYKEKSFNTCAVGYGFSSTHECRQQFLAVAHFRLQCRDTEGTVSSADHILTPITSSSIKWSIGSATGTTKTDGAGFGQIVTVLPKSSRRERIRITSDSKFVIVRANEFGRFVVPRDWCE